MSVSKKAIHTLTVMAANTPFSLHWVADSNVQQSAAAPAEPTRCIVPPMRMETVLAIRQQLTEGRYDLDKGLDVVVDRLFKELNL
jgi:hypothetical protein